jgi:TM2 domain-containing membrane protein YozV
MTEQTTSIQVNLTGKNVIVAYLLWWFLGWAGVHRLYLGRVKTGLAQLLLFAIGVVTLILLVGYIFLAISFLSGCSTLGISLETDYGRFSYTLPELPAPTSSK